MAESTRTSVKRSVKTSEAAAGEAKPKAAKPKAPPPGERAEAPIKAARPRKAPAVKAAAATDPGPAAGTGKRPGTGKTATPRQAAPAAKKGEETAGKPASRRKVVAKPAAPSSEERQRWIATAAYHRAEKRGFAPGYEMLDWLEAEAEIDALIGKA